MLLAVYVLAGTVYAVTLDMTDISAVAANIGGDSVGDVTSIQRHLVGSDMLQGIYLFAADINKDGELDINDAAALQKYIAEYELPYPVNEPIKVDYSKNQ